MSDIVNFSALLQRSSSVPLWRQIETDLTVDIQNGVYGPGDKLPSEQELVNSYGVNRHTVRMALANLAESRLVVAHRGRGVFVAEQPFEYRLSRDAKWSEVERHLDAKPNGRLLEKYEHPATRHLARLLALAEGTDLLITESVREAGGGVATYGYHIFEKARFAGLPEAFARSKSFTLALIERGVDKFFRASTWIDCRLPRPRESEVLNIPIEKPVVVMSYLDCDADGLPVLYGHAVMPTGAVRIRIDSADIA